MAITNNGKSRSRNTNSKIRNNGYVIMFLALFNCKKRVVYSYYSLFNPLFIPFIGFNKSIRVAIKTPRGVLRHFPKANYSFS